VKRFRDDWSFDAWMGGALWSRAFRLAAGEARFWLARLLCRMRGHELYDDGFADSESGCIDINCRRCGESFGREWLY
jgi:hypothetical protein